MKLRRAKETTGNREASVERCQRRGDQRPGRMEG
ncbi:rCG28382 [Rattus norvegicus]|uniref:RCG28382 n=1 Tax=Rattus norvegicus TaxID=10116 RepID=A6KTY5_RAT|nr:rCG28382 [Rattus norvegicus]